MKFVKKGLRFDGWGGGVNCFYKDIFTISRQRNVFFFLSQLEKGLIMEWKSKGISKREQEDKIFQDWCTSEMNKDLERTKKFFRIHFKRKISKKSFDTLVTGAFIRGVAHGSRHCCRVLSGEHRKLFKPKRKGEVSRT